MKRILKLFALTILIFNVVCISAYANSGPSYWYGTDSSDVIIREDCPLVVKNEVLTFDINNQLNDYYTERDAEEFEKYTDKFVAQYTFYNPTENDITAQLAFPLGIMPQYVNLARDMSRYMVTVNGEEIEKEIRYTKAENYYEFDFKTEMPKLVDGYIEDDFFHPDMLVTKYTVTAHTDEEIDHKRQIRINLNNINSQVRRILPVRIDSYSKRQGMGIQITAGIYNSYDPVIYVIGQPLEEFFEYGFYESWEDNAEEINASIEIKQETTTLENMLTELCTRENTVWNVSPMDTYNMFVSRRVTDDYYEREGIIHTEDIYFYAYNLICWYLYQITVPAGETVINTVTAPLYPDVELNYNPRKYGYTYLLSPAQQWARFENLEININTPFHMLESNQKNFEKTENGYTYKGDGLLKGELEFTLCASEKPQQERNNAYALFIGIPVLLFLGLIVGFVVFMVNLYRKYD